MYQAPKRSCKLPEIDVHPTPSRSVLIRVRYGAAKLQRIASFNKSCPVSFIALACLITSRYHF
jgi:hypothetical protein